MGSGGGGGRRAGGVAFALQCSIIMPAPTKAHLAKRRFTLLEDNDNAGNRSKEGRAAKSAGRMAILDIPKHSPDLNVMDFAVWAEAEKRMRRQERAWPEDKRETRQAFIKRLARTAKALPEDFINKSVSDFKRRCELLYKARGGLFEEGGRAPKSRRST